MLKALIYIERYRYLTVNQVACITGLKPKSASETLLRMQRGRLLGFFGNVGVRGYGKTPKLYFLTKAGHRMLEEEMSARGSQIGPYKIVNRSARWSPKMFHRIATLDVMMGVEKGIASRTSYALPATFVEYRQEMSGGRYVGETTDYVSLPKCSETKIVPDAGLVIENTTTQARALFLIEVDLGTVAGKARVADHVRSSFHHRIQQYDRYLTGGRFKERYRAYGSFRYFITLVVTNSERRLQNMREILSDLPEALHQYYRFSTLADCCGNFFHSTWRGRHKDDRRAYALIREGMSDESRYQDG